MRIIELPTELLVAIADQLRVEGENPSVAACRDFVNFSLTSRHFYDVAELPLKTFPEFNGDFHSDGFLTKKQTNDIFKHLAIDQIIRNRQSRVPTLGSQRSQCGQDRCERFVAFVPIGLANFCTVRHYGTCDLSSL
jgi:hypothetical protein